jgi:hypothetical protein
MGITPEQFYERYPYRVRGAQAVQEGQPLEQVREVVDPVGREYLEGTTELEVVAFEPYQEGQTNEATHVVRTLQPIVRQNGQIIQRGQVVVREGSPQYLARQEQFQEAKRAEMRARLVGAQQPLEQANQFDQAGQRKTDTPEFRQWNERPTEQGGTNKLVDAQGQPLRFYHGTSRGGFTQFDPAFLGTGAGYSRGGFSFVTSREQAEAYAELGSEDTRILDSKVAEINALLKEPGMYDRFVAAGIDVGVFDDGPDEPPTYFETRNLDGGVRELNDYLDDEWLRALRKVNDLDLVLRVGAIRDIGRPTAEPQVYEVYLYAGQQVKEFEATPDTIGDVLAGIDVRSQPGGAVIVNMSNGDKVVIVSDPTNIKSTDNRGTFSRATPNIFEQARREPAPEKGVFDANNPPADVTAEGSRKAIMAVMDYEGKIYYDRSATMHGDLLDSFPELDADLIIDGGFIRDGKYIPNTSDGGFAAIEGGRERLALVKAFANKANQRAGAVDAVVQIDIDYLDAVERGDMATAQRMVDEASYAQGYQIEAFHGTDAKDFAAFKYGDTYNWGPALYFSPSREYATEYQDRTGEGEPRVMRVKLRIDNMFSPESKPEHQALYRRLAQEARDEGLTHQEFDISGPQGTKVKYGNTGLSNLVTYTDQWWLVEKLWREGFDGFRTTEADGETVGIAVRDPSQVKLADPVTYDEAGNVVPLSRRFDITSPKVFEQAAMATRVPSAVKPLENALEEVLLADYPTFLRDAQFVAKNLAKFKQLKAPIRIDETLTDQEQIEQIIEHMKGNLLWLHDVMDANIRERAKMWLNATGCHPCKLQPCLPCYLRRRIGTRMLGLAFALATSLQLKEPPRWMRICRTHICHPFARKSPSKSRNSAHITPRSRH